MKKNKFIFFILIFIYCMNFVFANYKTLELDEINGYNMALRSAIYPGLGQLYMDDKDKGYLFMSISTLSILGAVYYKNSSDKKYSNYVEQGGKSNDSYNDYRDDLDLMYIFIGVAVLNYAYSIYDAYKTGSNIYYSKRHKELPISMYVKDKNIFLSYSKKI